MRYLHFNPFICSEPTLREGAQEPTLTLTELPLQQNSPLSLSRRAVCSLAAACGHTATGKQEPTARARQQRGEAFPSSAAGNHRCSRYLHRNPTPLCSAAGLPAPGSPARFGGRAAGTGSPHSAHRTRSSHVNQAESTAWRREERKGAAQGTPAPARSHPAAAPKSQQLSGVQRQARDGTRDATERPGTALTMTQFLPMWT